MISIRNQPLIRPIMPRTTQTTLDFESETTLDFDWETCTVSLHIQKWFFCKSTLSAKKSRIWKQPLILNQTSLFSLQSTEIAQKTMLERESESYAVYKSNQGLIPKVIASSYLALITTRFVFLVHRRTQMLDILTVLPLLSLQLSTTEELQKISLSNHRCPHYHSYRRHHTIKLQIP